MVIVGGLRRWRSFYATEQQAQIYSLHRPSAASSLWEVPAEKLEEIATRTRGATGVSVEVIVAAAPYRPRFSEPGQR